MHDDDHDLAAFAHGQFNWEYEHFICLLRSNVSRSRASNDSRPCAHKNIILRHKVIFFERLKAMAIPRSMKWMLWIVGTLATLFIGAVLLLAWLSSGLVGEPSKDEVARFVSPTGKVDAVLFETNGGATTSFGYEIYVAEHGAEPAGSPAISLYGAVRNEHAYGANLKRASPHSVAVEFLSAKSAKIKQQTQLIGAQAIHFAVHEGVTDNAAPPDGMLYNLRGRQ